MLKSDEVRISEIQKALDKYIKEVRERGGNLHSLILYHTNEVLCEEYFGNNDKDKLHRMFSIAKSITAYAILHIISKGKLSFNDKICDYFPEYVSEKTHEFVKILTIEDMLKMKTCYSKTTYKLSKNEWVRTFFETEPDHRPGTLFAYDTSSAHVLSALVEKLEKVDPLTYIKMEIPAIGLSEESYMLKDPDGISMGGSGFVAKSRDLLKIGCFLLDSYKLSDSEFSEKYNTAVSYRNLIYMACGGNGEDGLRTPTVIRAKSAFESFGYGMMTWRCDHEGFMCYGMGGQFIAVYPDRELILVTTADNQGKPCGNDAVFDGFYNKIYPLFNKEGTCNATDCNNIEHNIKYNLVFFLEQNPQGFEKLELKKEGNNKYKFVLYGVEKYELFFRLQEIKDIIYRKEGASESGIFPKYNQYYDGRGCLTDDNTLYLVFDVNDAYLGSVHVMLRFDEDNSTADIFMKKIEESLFDEFKGYFVGKTC